MEAEANGQSAQSREFGSDTGIPSWKRALDLTCMLLASPGLLLIGALVALFIAVVSGGPILFKQPRIGYRGRQFLCFKFRTMAVGAGTDKHEGYFADLICSEAPMRKLDDTDDRLLPGSRFIRALGLDELPQFINVLRGEMSLVGPRPAVPYEYERYLPHHRKRCLTAPGLTGLWQVSGKNRTTFDQMVSLDLRYIRERSLMLDLKIMALTFPCLLWQVLELAVGRKSRRTADA